MSLNEAPNPSAPWKAFLQGVDQLLQTAVELHCLGGFVLSVLYDLPRPTADVDYIAAMPSLRSWSLKRLPAVVLCFTRNTGCTFSM